MITSAAIATILNVMLNQKFLSIFGTFRKKLLNSSFLAVTPQVMLISNMCVSRALDRWIEMPLKKINR